MNKQTEYFCYTYILAPNHQIIKINKLCCKNNCWHVNPILNLIVFFLKHVVQENVEDGRSMIGFLLVIADSERDMPGIETGPQGWHTSS